MHFLIADTFTDSLTRLSGDEQKAVKTTAFDLQLNPASPGMSFHKLDRARDKRFWSVRVSTDIRLIVHRSDDNLLLCYVDHHDKAYAWAERRKLETHPKTGAAQLVEIRETVHEISVPRYVETVEERPAKSARPLFESVSDESLLGYGVPQEWLADVRAATEDSLLEVVDHLPAEAAEALLELATGGTPRVPEVVGRPENPFEHPDAQRRFRVMTNVEELERALAFPWDKWTVFLHPDQRQLVTRDFTGPARVAGSAGTGKTIVALHRAAHVARSNPDARVLLTTFSDALANALLSRLRRLLSSEPRLAERIDVSSMRSLGERLHRALLGPVTLVEGARLREMMELASRAVDGHRFSVSFLLSEWEHVVDAWQVATWETYRDVPRLGRKTRLPEGQRATLWEIFERLRELLGEAGLMTEAAMFSAVTNAMSQQRNRPYDAAIIDEAQDLGIAQLRFLAGLAGDRPNGLFFAGDLGQRIFQQPFSWKSLGVDIRGRSRTLRVNYRTSHQIRMMADRLLGPSVSDVDGNVESRGDAISVFNGPAPRIERFEYEEAEIIAVLKWIWEVLEQGVEPHEIAVFVRTEEERWRAIAAISKAGPGFVMIDEQAEPVHDCVSIGTMHLAKGLEFRAVAVMGCNDEVIPLQSRIESVGDEADLREVYETERHLLYVACTRARDYLFVTGVEPVSEFVADMQIAKQ
jgi:mRNA-degrading endonuclease RelE of RelBE toxin-antitoxin system